MADTFLLTEAQIHQKKPASLSPPKVETEAEKRQRHWDQILKKIQFNPESDDYYSKWPIKPGKSTMQSRNLLLQGSCFRQIAN